MTGELIEASFPFGQGRIGELTGRCGVAFAKGLGIFLDLIVDLAQVQGCFGRRLKVSLLFELCVSGRLGLGLHHPFEPLIDRLDRVSNRIEDPSTRPHSANGGLVQLSKPVGFAQSTAILSLGTEVTEFAVLEHQYKNRAIGLVCHRMDQLAKVGLIAKPHA